MITADCYTNCAPNEKTRASGTSSRTVHDNNLTLDPDFVVTRDGYHVRFAHGIEQARSKVSLLVERMYAWRGLHAHQPVMQDDRPGQTTLVACRGDHVFGTVTIGIDSGDGLLADALYREQIDAAREEGGRVCELTRLAMDPSFNTPEVMSTVFHLAFMVARFIHDMTDLFVEVHPRHARFYRRMLDCRIVGPERICPRVGAPAVLLQLPLEHVERQISRLGGNRSPDDRSLYRLFFSPAEQQNLVRRMRTMRQAA